MYDEWVRIDGGAGRKWRPGVYWHGIQQIKGIGEVPVDTWVCSPLHVEAITSDPQDNNFGRLLRFRNSMGRWRTWAMPMELLRGSGEELRGELLAMGVEIDPKGRMLLGQYLQKKPPKNRVRCALQVGWCGGAYVLPDAVIGPDADKVIFQSGERFHDEHGCSGSLQGWRDQIAARAALVAKGLMNEDGSNVLKNADGTPGQLDPPQAAALFTYHLIEEDKSNSVHNPNYYNALVDAALAYLAE